MKVQWTWILGLLFAVIIAVFSVVNIDAVRVNYILGTAEWPLVLVILGSALLGSAVSGFIALFKSFKAKHEFKELRNELDAKELLIQAQQNEIEQLNKHQPKDKRRLLENEASILGAGEVIEVIPPTQK